ncbi:hypothetical protein EDD91_2300 [Streptomyces sp. KS 21]|nr:hypothetical protein EDD91_2300 [Streptomyces sp. KS 21]
MAGHLDEHGPGLRGDRGAGQRPGDARRPRPVRRDLVVAAAARRGGVVGHGPGDEGAEPRHRAERGEREERPQAVALPGGGVDGAGRDRSRDRERQQHLLHQLGARGPRAPPGVDGQAPRGQALRDRGGGGGGGDELPEPVRVRRRRACCPAEGLRLDRVGRRGVPPYAGPGAAVGADGQHPGQVQRGERHFGNALPAAVRVRGFVQAEHPGVRPVRGVGSALQQDAGEGHAEQWRGRIQEDVDPHRRPRLRVPSPLRPRVWACPVAGAMRGTRPAVRPRGVVRAGWGAVRLTGKSNIHSDELSTAETDVGAHCQWQALASMA